jgi:hypothetical protein
MLVLMIRRVAIKVPLFHNKLQSVAYYHIAKIKLTTINRFLQLTNLPKMKVGRAFSCLKINLGQTLRQFLRTSKHNHSSPETAWL